MFQTCQMMLCRIFSVEFSMETDGRVTVVQTYSGNTSVSASSVPKNLSPTLEISSYGWLVFLRCRYERDPDIIQSHGGRHKAQRSYTNSFILMASIFSCLEKGNCWAKLPLP